MFVHVKRGDFHFSLFFENSAGLELSKGTG